MNDDHLNDDHLTSEQMEALLLNDVKQDVKQDATETERSQHLSSCLTCSEEVESLRLTVGDLRVAAARLAAVGASERQWRTALMPEPSRRTQHALWAVLAAAALICTAGPIAVRHRPLVVEKAASAPKQQVQGDMSDEQLLSNVQSDLASAVPEPMLPLEASVSANANSSTYTANENATSTTKENE